MEKKKNNAVEKVENVSKKSEKSSPKKATNKKAKERLKKQKQILRANKKEERKKLLAEKKAERKALKEQKRAELKNKKAHQKAEKEKAKATALRERNRRKEQRKLKKQEMKDARQKRKDALKRETKTQRAKRLINEKRAKREQKRQRQERKGETKRQKLLAKKEKKEQKRIHRAERRKDRKGFGGWLAAVISLGVVTLVLASVLTFTFLVPRASDTLLETTYQRAFYDTVMQVDNMDLNLSKALATKDSGALQKYLVDLAINSELAENDIQELPLQDESKFYTAKLINQIGDYAKYLNKKLIDGEGITKEEYQTLKRLYSSNLTLKNTLKRVMDGIGEDYSFTELASADTDDLVLSSLNELQNLSVEYPELIYDGPFSDGLDKITAKGITGEEISASKALEKFNSLFSGYGVENAENVGALDGVIPCYNVQGEIDGDVIFAQISKQGGNLIMFAYAGTCESVKIEQDTAIEIAEKYLNELGYENMNSVWANLAGNVYTINLAYIKDGIIVYPDLVKVRVCGETGKVIGLEASSYYQSHTERTIESAKISEKTARESVLDGIEIFSVRKALVPIGEKTEKLCYEFSGEMDGDTYYVYIDAISGKQVEMFKVVSGTEGTLLM